MRNEKDGREATRLLKDPESATPAEVKWLCLRLQSYMGALHERDEDEVFCETYGDGHYQLSVSVVTPGDFRRYKGVLIRHKVAGTMVEFTIGGSIALDLAEKLVKASLLADPLVPREPA